MDQDGTMALGIKVGLGPGDIVLDRTQLSLYRKRHSSPHFLALV